MEPKTMKVSNIVMINTDGEKVCDIGAGIVDINNIQNTVNEETIILNQEKEITIEIKPPSLLQKLTHIMQHAKSGRIKKKQASRIEKECGWFWLLPYCKYN